MLVAAGATTAVRAAATVADPVATITPDVAGSSSYQSYGVLGVAAVGGVAALYKLAQRLLHSVALDKSGLQVRKDLDESVIDLINDLKDQLAMARQLAEKERDRADNATRELQNSMAREGEMRGQLTVISAQMAELKEEVSMLRQLATKGNM